MKWILVLLISFSALAADFKPQSDKFILGKGSNGIAKVIEVDSDATPGFESSISYDETSFGWGFNDGTGNILLRDLAGGGGGATSIFDLTDVDATSAFDGHVLRSNGTTYDSTSFASLFNDHNSGGGGGGVQQTIFYYYQTNSGTSGGATVASSYTTYPVNTIELTPDASGSLAGNLMRIPAGEYHFESSCPIYGGGGTTTRLVRSPGTVVRGGLTVRGVGGGSYMLRGGVNKVNLVIASEGDYYVQVRTTNSSANGMGFPASIPVTGEIYCLITWKCKAGACLP